MSEKNKDDSPINVLFTTLSIISAVVSLHMIAKALSRIAEALQ